MVSAENMAISDTMNHLWRTFAKTGDPNFDGAPAIWPSYAPDANENDERIQFNPDGYETVKSFRKPECKLWSDYAAAQ